MQIGRNGKVQRAVLSRPLPDDCRSQSPERSATRVMLPQGRQQAQGHSQQGRFAGVRAPVLECARFV
jgi:hypothetical protein